MTAVTLSSRDALGAAALPAVATPSASGSALLEVRDLSVTYQTGRGPVSAVSGISFDVQAGESVGIVGESGSGKSTVLRAMLGLLPKNATVTGSIRFDGQELTALDEKSWRRVRGSKIGIIVQDPTGALNPSIPVGKQLARVMRLHRPDIPANRRPAEVAEILRQVGVDARAAVKYPFEFSQGQLQRVMIAAAALAGRPVLVLADEPTTSLDVTVEAQILELLGRLQAERGLALVLISHDLAVVTELCERAVVMYSGTVVERLDTQTMVEGETHPYTRLLLDAIPKFPSDGAELVTIPAPIREQPSFAGACAFASRCPRHIAACSSEPVSFQPTAIEGQQVLCHLFVPNTEVAS